MVARVGSPADSSSVPTIRHLIREALAAGRSVRDLEADSGYRVKHQTFGELSNDAPKGFPKRNETITGMARALHVSESAVVLAYASSLGVAVTGRSEFSLRLPADVDDLDERMKRSLISVVRAALAVTGDTHAQMELDSSEGTAHKAEEESQIAPSPDEVEATAVARNAFGSGDIGFESAQRDGDGG